MKRNYYSIYHILRNLADILDNYGSALQSKFYKLPFEDYEELEILECIIRETSTYNWQRDTLCAMVEDALELIDNSKEEEE